MGHNIDLNLYLLPHNIWFSFIPPTFELTGSLKAVSLYSKEQQPEEERRGTALLYIICKSETACL